MGSTVFKKTENAGAQGEEEEASILGQLDDQDNPAVQPALVVGDVYPYTAGAPTEWEVDKDINEIWKDSNYGCWNFGSKQIFKGKSVPHPFLFFIPQERLASLFGTRFAQDADASIYVSRARTLTDILADVCRFAAGYIGDAVRPVEGRFFMVLPNRNKNHIVEALVGVGIRNWARWRSMYYTT